MHIEVIEEEGNLLTVEMDDKALRVVLAAGIEKIVETWVKNHPEETRNES